MTLDEILSEYKLDSAIDDTALDIESRRIPGLHQKYLLEYSACKKALKKATSKYNRIEKDMWEYYAGRMGHDDLKRYGLLPFGHRVLKTDIDKYLRSDIRLQEQEIEVELYENMLDVLTRILSELNNRQWQIKNMIEWRKFTNGG